ncbi:MAG TPA: hypothetical protein VI603_14890 [Saprospiraceae bacterium]|nr:hypothetical protein [Saprospiraceae bacterium]
MWLLNLSFAILLTWSGATATGQAMDTGIDLDTMLLIRVKIVLIGCLLTRFVIKQHMISMWIVGASSE